MNEWITVDLDYPSVMRILKTYHYLNGMSDKVQLRKSSTKGVHFRAMVEDMSFEERLVIRKLVGDDENRVAMDCIRNDVSDSMATEVLWDEKDVNKVEEWREGYRSLEFLIDDLEKSAGAKNRSYHHFAHIFPPSLTPVDSKR